jgi:hypothetical protein
MTETTEVPAKAPLAASDVYRQMTGCGNKRQEGVSMEAPVTVMARGSRPDDPVPGVLVPRVSQHG